MKLDFKKFLFLIMASLLLCYNNYDDTIDHKETADLGIAVAASTNNTVANTNITFTLTATNKGPLDAK